MLKLTILMKMLPVAVKNWRLTIIGILLSFIWYQNNSVKLYMDIETLPYVKTQLTMAEEAIQTCADGNASLSDSINKRNEEVAKWQATSSALQTQNTVLSDEIVVVKKTTRSKVASVLKRKTPQSCTEAFKMLSDGVEELTWDE